MSTNGDDERSTPEQDEQAPRVARLWVSNSGRVACDAHGGMYLAVAVEQAPRRRHHTTPLDAWEGYTAREVALYLDGDTSVLSCEDSRCGARIGPSA
ncbi:hypothetical protein WDV85_16970 [Pseudokineococcus sp. 5B2Z-1]|uniref:hypothetical protein n=1 Tax=Pseudokineococcus sp. 5B2Z-1 TaxID=3132744 RepID=UPI0030958E3A